MTILHTRLSVLLGALVCAAAGVIAAAQVPVTNQPSTGTGAVSGIVVDGTTGQPLAGAVVYLGESARPGVPMTRGPAGLHQRQITDARGRFVFVDLPPSENLGLSASRAGYLAGGYNQLATPGSSNAIVTLGDGEWVRDIRIPLWKPGVIEGVVVDELNQPAVGVEVRTLVLVRIAGRDQYAAGSFTVTDDRGRYRIADLAPGRYLVAVPSVQPSISAWRTQASLNNMSDAMFATPDGRARATTVPTLETGTAARVALGPYPVPPPPVAGQTFGYPLTFHPGTSSVSEATAIEIAFGTVRSAADVRLSPRPTGHLSGRLEGQGQIANLLVRLLSVDGLGLGFETATARTGVDGAFEFANVPFGSYVLDVSVHVNEYQASTAGSMMPRAPMPPGFGNFNSVIDGVRGAPPGISIASYSSGSTTFTGGAVNSTTDNASALWTRVPVTINAPQSPQVLVSLQAASTIAGRLVIETDAASGAAPGGSPRIVIEVANGSVAQGRAIARFDSPASGSPGAPGADRPFLASGVLPGAYLVRNVNAGWTIKSVTYGGRDYTDSPIDVAPASSITGVVVTATRNGATIAGTVTRFDGVSAAGTRVGVFPVDRRLWVDFGLSPSRIADAMASSTGAYQIESLPAGDYYVVVVPDTWAEVWRSDEYFARMAGSASSVTVGWGETRRHDLRAITP